MIYGRDGRVDPLNEIQILAETERLSTVIALWMAKGLVLNADEKISFDILTKCRVVHAAPWNPPP